MKRESRTWGAMRRSLSEIDSGTFACSRHMGDRFVGCHGQGLDVDEKH